MANKVIDGYQCTLCWYVDDNKLSHKNKKVVSQIIKLIEGHFSKLQVQRDDELFFLGMDVTINQKDKPLRYQ